MIEFYEMENDTETATVLTTKRVKQHWRTTKRL